MNIDTFSIEKLENLLPTSFQERFEGVCYHCSKENLNETITYERNIEVRSNYNQRGEESRKYSVSYSPKYYKNFKDIPSDIKFGNSSQNWENSLRNAFLRMYKMLVERGFLKLKVQS